MGNGRQPPGGRQRREEEQPEGTRRRRRALHLGQASCGGRPGAQGPASPKGGDGARLLGGRDPERRGGTLGGGAGSWEAGPERAGLGKEPAAAVGGDSGGKRAAHAHCRGTSRGGVKPGKVRFRP